MGWVQVIDELDDISDVSASSAVEGDMLYRNDSGLWVVVDGTKTVGHIPKIQSDGTIAWAADNDTGGGNGGGVLNTLDTVDTAPSTPDAMDDEFDDASFDSGLWTNLNIGSVTKDERDHALVLQAAGSDGAQLRGVYQSAPSGDFTIQAKLLRTPNDGTLSQVLFVAASTTGQVYEIGYRVNRVQAASRTSPTGGASAWGSNITSYFQNYLYVEVDWDDTGGTLAVRFSWDGTTWSGNASGSLAGGWTPGIVGLGLENQTSTALHFGYDWFRRTT